MGDNAGFRNPPEEAIRQLLKDARSIAVVGCSPNPARPSYRIARALQGFGYRVIPVRPALREVLGERAWASLDEVPESVDIVNVFRAPDQVPPIVEACLRRGFRALWLQDGVINEAAARRARDTGMTVVMDRCIWRDWLDLLT